LANDGVAIGEGVDAMMALDAALEFGREMAEFVWSGEVGKNVAETKFGRWFREIDVREPVHFVADFKLQIANRYRRDVRSSRW
jgi:hypothetical protein